MKLILIKIGKAFTTIRRDGLIVGGRRVLNYLFLFLKTILSAGSGDILIITGGVGDSAHYRAYNQAEEFNLHGIKSAIMLQDNPWLPRYANKFKIFIFHRTIETPIVTKLITRIKQQNKEIIFDTDDLVFDAKYIQATDLYKNKMTYFEKKQYEKGVGEEILKDEYVKTCSTTTSYLAKILESYGKKVFISLNKTSNAELLIADNILKSVPREVADDVKLGYFSGTNSHNLDFATITDALLDIMERHANVKLLLAGPLDTENRLNKFSERIIRLPLVSRENFYYNLYKADINLAPLVLGDPFCEAKSEIKFSGAGVLEIPTVAVANQTFQEAITDGVDGFLAKDVNEWIEKLDKLIIDKEFRIKMGKQAQMTVLKKYTNKNSHNEEYYAYLRSKL
jgi:glycosyltransferase involved in cell wall biosynthesis